jgi:DMSO/TMAO reductase YedYZ molybdopterin-dependent catalytic subunit
VTADIHCSSAEKAAAVRMFIEGMRSLMMINNEGLPLADTLSRIKILSEGTEVYVSASMTDVFEFGF